MSGIFHIIVSSRRDFVFGFIGGIGEEGLTVPLPRFFISVDSKESRLILRVAATLGWLGVEGEG
jgi:hypothetical protein